MNEMEHEQARSEEPIQFDFSIRPREERPVLISVHL
jgi:hypothetical protein